MITRRGGTQGRPRYFPVVEHDPTPCAGLPATFLSKPAGGGVYSHARTPLSFFPLVLAGQLPQWSSRVVSVSGLLLPDDAQHDVT